MKVLTRLDDKLEHITKKLFIRGKKDAADSGFGMYYPVCGFANFHFPSPFSSFIT